MKTLALLLFALITVSNVSEAAPKRKKHRQKTYQTKPHKRHSKGFKRDKESKKQMQSLRHLSFSQVDAKIPGHIDLSPMVSLPENQGSCGSCWDFALTKALRSEYMLAHKDPGVLDFNYLLNNCGPGPKQGGCNGGSFSAARSFLNSAGPSLNALNPYRGVQGKCQKLGAQATATSYAMVGTAAKGPTFKDLTYLIGVQRHMIVTDVAAGQGEWEDYADGIYNDCQGSADNIDHMVTLVGYSCGKSIDKNGNCVFDAKGRALHHDEALLVENSWGEDGWGTKALNGHGGYMWTRMYGSDGKKCNAIAEDALVFYLEPEIKSETL